MGPVTALVGWIVKAVVDSSEVWLDYLWYVTRMADAFIYIFNPVLVAIIHRQCTGRRRWARFTTRTLCIVESTANYKLLRAYTSKLLALTWRFATMSVVGQNGTDHFVHEYTHKAQSDVLVAVGLPDGRLTSLASSEACTMMSLQQAKFIKQLGIGTALARHDHGGLERPRHDARGLHDGRLEDEAWWQRKADQFRHGERHHHSYPGGTVGQRHRQCDLGLEDVPFSVLSRKSGQHEGLCAFAQQGLRSSLGGREGRERHGKYDRPIYEEGRSRFRLGRRRRQDHGPHAWSGLAHAFVAADCREEH